MTDTTNVSGATVAAPGVAAMSTHGDRVVETVQQHNRDALAAIAEGEFEGAARLLHEAVMLAQGEAHQKELATSLNNLGCLAKRLGKLSDAKRYLQDAVNAETAAFGEAMLSTQLNLSTLYTALNEIPSAILLAKQVVDRSVPVPGEDFSVVAFHNLAVAQLCASDEKTRREGIETLKTGLRLSQELLGPDAEVTKAIEARLQRYHKQKKVVEQSTVVVRSHQPTAPSGPAPPSSQYRNAAGRALRALDFATPTEEEEARARSSRLSHHQPQQTVGGGDKDDAALPAKAEVMQGATFVDGPAVPPSDGKPVVSEPTSTAETSVRDEKTAPVVSTQQGSDNDDSSATRADSKTSDHQVVAPPPFVASAARRRSSVSTKERRYMRFTAEIETVPPPIPIGFKELKMEAAIRVSDGTNHRDEVEVVKAAPESKPEAVSVFKKSVQKKFNRHELELEDERRLAARHKREAEEAAIKAAEDARLKAANELREHHCAKIIQKRYLQWRARSSPRRTRIQRTVEQQKDVGKARLVRRFANRWLRKTAGQRLLARLTLDPNSRRRLDYETVNSAVRSVQRAWRLWASRRRAQRLREYRALELTSIASEEHRLYAAVCLQRWYRKFLADRRMTTVRSEQYTEHILVIQRWGRRTMERHRNLLSVVSESRARHIASTRIQAAWRGRVARLTVAVMRLKRKILRMRQHETNSAAIIQKAGRGMRCRNVVGLQLRQKRAAQLRLPQDVLAKAKNAEVPSSSTRAVVEKFAPHANYTRFEDRREEMRAVDQAQRDLYLELVVDPQTERFFRSHDTPISQREHDLARAHEHNYRQQELAFLRATRAAKMLQRLWRRWRWNMTDERRQRANYVKAEFRHQHYLKKERQLEEQLRQERLRAANDLGADARALKEETKKEMYREAAVYQEDTFLERDIEEREATAKQLRQQEEELARRLENEKRWLREEEVKHGVRTFRTLKELRAERARKERFETELVDRENRQEQLAIAAEKYNRDEE